MSILPISIIKFGFTGFFFKNENWSPSVTRCLFILCTREEIKPSKALLHLPHILRHALGIFFPCYPYQRISCKASGCLEVFNVNKEFFGEYGNQCSNLTFADNAWKFALWPFQEDTGGMPGVKSWAAVPALGQSLYEACPSRILIQMGKFSLENRLQWIWSIESRQPIKHFTGSSKKPP